MTQNWSAGGKASVSSGFRAKKQVVSVNRVAVKALCNPAKIVFRVATEICSGRRSNYGMKQCLLACPTYDGRITAHLMPFLLEAGASGVGIVPLPIEHRPPDVARN